MRKNRQEKSLVCIGSGIFDKLNKFFKKIFNRNITTTEEHVAVKENSTLKTNENKSSFWEDIGDYENNEAELLELQKLYRSGEISEDDLTSEQLNELSKLFDRQIARLKESNSIRMEKILEYRKKQKNP